MEKICIFIIVSSIFINGAITKKFDDETKPSWAKKDIRDYNEADLERLLDQWEEDEEPLEPDELPEHLRPQQKFDFDPSKMQDPELLLKMSKKGKSVMMFVKVKAEYSKEEVEDITKLWQGSLHNNHIQAERYMVDDSRSIFMFTDGSMAWDAKDFLIEQTELQDCTIDNKVYHGMYTKEAKEEKKSKSAGAKSKSEL